MACFGSQLCGSTNAAYYGLGNSSIIKKALEIIQTEADMTMALCGRRDVQDLNLENIYKKK